MTCETYVAKNLKYLRRIRGISQETAAERLKIGRNRYAAWEEERAEPNCQYLILLSSTFMVTIDDLIKTDIENNVQVLTKTLHL